MKKFSKIITLVLTVVMLLSMTSISAYAANEQVFSDVKPGAWYYEAVNTMAENGLLAGYSDGNFHPDDPITYGQFAMILCRITGRPTDNPTHYHSGHLCTVNHWAAGALLRINSTSIFCRVCSEADEKLWRGEALQALVTMAHKMPKYGYDYSTGEFGVQVSAKTWTWDDIADADAVINRTGITGSHRWSQPTILDAYNLGLTSGTDSKGTCNPTGTVSRAQMCQMLYNMGITGPNSVKVNNSSGFYS